LRCSAANSGPKCGHRLGAICLGYKMAPEALPGCRLRHTDPETPHHSGKVGVD